MTPGRTRIRFVLLAVAAALFAPSPSLGEDQAAPQEVIEPACTLIEIWAAESIAKRRCSIDADADGVGEYATLQELAGRCGVRAGREAPSPGRAAGSTFRSAGKALDPATLTLATGAVDGDGALVRGSYAIRVLLPDTSDAHGLVHETAGASVPGLAGGTGVVGIDRSEKAWYGWAAPLELPDKSASSWCLFVTSDGRLLHSTNEKARRCGRAAPPDSLIAVLAVAKEEVLDDAGETWRPVPPLRRGHGGPELSSNEMSAAACLANVAACEAGLQRTGQIDADGDGIGEYGTFLELTGSCGKRRGVRAAGGSRTAGADFSVKGLSLPAFLNSSLSKVTSEGVVVRNGYVFQIFLPDSGLGTSSGFVHETGPAESVGLTGGTGAVGIDLSETHWCAYAQPLVRGKTGNRCFFVNQSGDVMQSANEVAKHEGANTPIDPTSAFKRGVTSITGEVATGARGNDGDVWKATN